MKSAEEQAGGIGISTDQEQESIAEKFRVYREAINKESEKREVLSPISNPSTF